MSIRANIKLVALGALFTAGATAFVYLVSRLVGLALS